MENTRKKMEKVAGKENRTISYSRNVFLPITNLCVNKCDYCGFRKKPKDAWIMSKEEVIEKCKEGKKKNCSEALITLGERPEKHEMMKTKLESWGFSSTVDYLVELTREILDLGLLPHVNAGVLKKGEQARLKKYSASMGLMLESIAELPVHENSPTKKPKIRLKAIKEAGELKIPLTTGILVGIGEKWEDRIRSLQRIREIQEKYGHIQEVIVQPFQPKKGTPMEDWSAPSHFELLNLFSGARGIMPQMNLQIPPNLTEKITDFIRLGADDLGGISTITPDFINPDHPWPNLKTLKSKVKEIGFKLRERLPIYSEYTKKPKFMSDEVSKTVEELSNEAGFRRK